ncbi:hypothetical protein M8818_007551 [Zalaria obscura]|uniref:Uncharacterized protein n=1 Tax=Zalaria obscura TaxID=2024903 RepID=A0ACC3S4K3_9PEZI
MPLLSLPNEILLVMINFTPPEAIENLLGTCRHLRMLGTARLARHKKLIRRYTKVDLSRNAFYHPLLLDYAINKDPWVASYVQEIQYKDEDSIIRTQGMTTQESQVVGSVLRAASRSHQRGIATNPYRSYYHDQLSQGMKSLAFYHLLQRLKNLRGLVVRVTQTFDHLNAWRVFRSFPPDVLTRLHRVEVKSDTTLSSSQAFVFATLPSVRSLIANPSDAPENAFFENTPLYETELEDESQSAESCVGRAVTRQGTRVLSRTYFRSAIAARFGTPLISATVTQSRVPFGPDRVHVLSFHVRSVSHVGPPTVQSDEKCHGLVTLAAGVFSAVEVGCVSSCLAAGHRDVLTPKHRLRSTGPVRLEPVTVKPLRACVVLGWYARAVSGHPAALSAHWSAQRHARRHGPWSLQMGGTYCWKPQAKIPAKNRHYIPTLGNLSSSSKPLHTAFLTRTRLF